VEVLEAFLTELNIPKVVLVGNSMGGKFAWQFAARYPNQVSKLVLISPDGYASPGIEYGKKTDVPAIAELYRYFFSKTFLAMNLEPAYANPKTLNDALVNRYYDLMLAPGVRGAILARMQQTVLQDPAPSLATIKPAKPTCCVALMVRTRSRVLLAMMSLMVAMVLGATSPMALTRSREVMVPIPSSVPLEMTASVAVASSLPLMIRLIR
jgi:pimeloyl-ACP methyl ester carboxylesterase